VEGVIPNNDPPNYPPGSDPIKPLHDALALLQDQLKREKHRADAAEKAAQEERQRVDQQAAELAELRERAARAEGESGVLREQITAERERAEAARAELAEWTAGGPLARAVRAFLNRRGRP
jgi:chromosome segregation ATPase